jgi:hypothetical protein
MRMAALNEMPRRRRRLRAEIPSLDWVIMKIPRNQVVRGNFEFAKTVPLIKEL